MSGVTGAVSSGATVTFSVEKKAEGEVYLTFVSGLSVTSVKTTCGGGKHYSAAVPATASGQVYVVLTSKNVTALSDDVVLAGPAIIEVNPPAPTIDYNQS